MKLNAKQHWIMLRVTALLNIPLMLWLVYSIVSLAGADYTMFTTWLAQPMNAALMIASVVSVFYHAALGAHEIIEDYVHSEGLKKTAMVGKVVALFILGAASVLAVLKVAL